VSAAAIAIEACRTVWPRHTAKHVARKWGRAVVTAKLWLRRGAPEYQIQMILADLDEELARQEAHLVRLRDEIRRARSAESSPSIGGAAGAPAHKGAAALHRMVEGGPE
jgi:hypothetical protein